MPSGIGAVAFYDHEFGPGFGVGGLFAFPGEVGFGNICVRRAGVGVGGGWFFEDVGHAVVGEVDAAEFLRGEVGPGSGESVEPFDGPAVIGGVVAADVHA